MAATSNGEIEAEMVQNGFGTKTPPPSERRQSPPLSASTRAPTVRKRNQSTAEDPFNFSTQSDVHPEPLKNISIERSSFNEVKYTKSLPSSADRYADMEKIAASRNPQLAVSLSAQSTNSPVGRSANKDSLSQLSSMTSSSLRLDFGDTPKSSNSSGGQRATITKLNTSRTTRKRRSNASTVASTTPRSTTAAKKTPRSAAKRRKRSTRANPSDDDDEEEDEKEEEMEVEEEVQQQQQEAKGDADQSLRMETNAEQQAGTPARGRRGRKPGTTPKGTTPSSPRTPAAGVGMPKTPERSSLRRTPGSLDSARKASQEQKRKDESLYEVPALTPDEQLAVDCPQDVHLFMGVGARVLALWGTDYYAANICGREALGRYYVHFAEDNLNRVLPPTGIVPVSALKPGTRVSFIDIVDNEEIGKVCDVVEQPSKEEATEWARGEFKLRELDEEGNPSDGTKSVSWEKLFMTKEQGHQLLQQLKQQSTPMAGCRTSHKLNPIQDIDEENIISDERSFRRSRSAALARISTSSTFKGAAGDGGTPAKTPTRVRLQPQSEDKEGGEVTDDEAVPSEQQQEQQPQNDEQVVVAVDGEEAAEDCAQQQQQRSPDEEQKCCEVTADDGSATSAEQKQQQPQPEDEEQKCDEVVVGDGSTASAEQQQQTQPKEDKKCDEVIDVGSTAISTDKPEEQQQQQPKNEEKKWEQVQSKATTSATGNNELAAPHNKKRVPESAIFSGLKFVLTSASRPNKKVTDFNKRDYRRKIEDRGGRIIEDFTHHLASDETAYLIADTYYRTHKYLSALSLSIPCVSYKWIQQCVAEKQLVDHRPFLLPAGESSLDSKQQFEWKPLKGVLMVGKRVLIWSNTTEPDPSVVSFAEIWTPILQNLGASLVGIGPGEPFAPKSSASLEEKMAFFSKIEPPVDVLLAETDCQAEVAKMVEERAGLAVSSEWVIQAIVTGSLPDLAEPGGEKFRYDFV